MPFELVKDLLMGLKPIIMRNSLCFILALTYLIGLLKQIRVEDEKWNHT